MGLNDYEKTLIKVLSENPDINTREFIKLSRLGKATFYKHVQILEVSGYVGYKTVKNQRVWFLIRRDKEHGLGMPDLEESVLDRKYHRIESTVMASLKKIRKGRISDKIDLYGDAVVLISTNIASMNLLSMYRHKQVPPSYVKFTKRLELLLQKISNERFFSDYGFGKTAIDVVAFGAESRLEEFLGIMRDRKVSIF